MAKKNLSRDRKFVSKQKHELAYDKKAKSGRKGYKVSSKMAKGGSTYAGGGEIKDMLNDNSVSFGKFYDYLSTEGEGDWDSVNSQEIVERYIEEMEGKGIDVEHIRDAIEENPSKQELYNIWLGNSMNTPIPINTKKDLLEALDLSNEYAKGGEIMFGSKWIKKGASPKTIYNIDNIDGDRIYFHSSRGTHYQRTRENFLKDYSKKGGSMASGGEVTNAEKEFYDSKESMGFNKLDKEWRINGIKPNGYDEAKSKAQKLAKKLNVKIHYAKGGEIREMYGDFYGEEPEEDMSVDRMRIALIEDYDNQLGKLEASIDAESDENFREEYRKEIKEINKILKKLNSYSYAKGGEVKLDSVKETKSHFGYSDEEWDDLTKGEQDDLREESMEHLTLGRQYKKEKSTFNLINGGWGLNLKWW